MSATPPRQAAPQLITVKLTGVQICRRLMLPHLNDEAVSARIWNAARQLGGGASSNPLTGLVAAHIACDQEKSIPAQDRTGWIAADPREGVFYRLLRIGSQLAIDMVIDTQNGAGKQDYNKIECSVTTGMLFSKVPHHLATFLVVPNDHPRVVAGTLVMDFGNTGTSLIFSPRGSRPLEVRPIFLHSPFDPLDMDEEERPHRERSILKSTLIMLNVPDNDRSEPWVVQGRRAEELIAQEDPQVTSLYAPKKYVRHWPDHLRPHEPTTRYRGLMGQQLGLHPVLDFVKRALANVMELSISSLVNPTFGATAPVMYPEIREIFLTYPLTWREAEKKLFQEAIAQIAARQLVLSDQARGQFRVELVCSEPVGVAAYVLWEAFFHFLHMAPRGACLRAPSLASSMFGNNEGSQELRLLVVDIGGGSTDVALVRATWEVADDEGTAVDVGLRVLESLRFNRAGDRISHLMATAILEYLRQKYGFRESLDLEMPSLRPGFTPKYKREVLSLIADLVDEAKAALSAGKVWTLQPDAEERFQGPLRGAMDAGIVEPQGEEGSRQLELSLPVLEQWIEQDIGGPQTRGEPGFMDIFYTLRDLMGSLDEGRRPHLVILSGRTTRLPFIKTLAAQYLGMPLHRIRTLGELLPDSLKSPDHENMDKLAVVYGAHRFRFGDPIRFLPLPEEPVFRRFVGTLRETPGGLILNRILVEPGAGQPQTCTLRVPAGGNILLGHAFRTDARAEIIATLSSSATEPREVELELIDDWQVHMRKHKGNEGVILTEWVPGGASVVRDNFNDTGRIDHHPEPEGLLRQIVLGNRDSWYRTSDNDGRERS